MNVDREQQRQILCMLFDAYPWITNDVSVHIKQMVDDDPSRTVGNLLYLQRHGLIEHCVDVIPGGREQVVVDGLETNFYHYHGCPALTEKGIDFLLGDEGLSAILNTRTIRIEESSLRTLSRLLIENANASEADKKSALEGLKKIPSDVLRRWLTELGDKAMPNQEVVLDLIRTALAFAS